MAAGLIERLPIGMTSAAMQVSVTIDLRCLCDDGICSLFVLPVRQDNHVRVTDYSPQEALVVEWALG